MTIFISGPMSGLPDFNYPSFHEAGEYLRGLGQSFMSPAHDWRLKPINPPHPKRELPWEYYMKSSIEKMMRCDRILMLPGWEKSRGATIEKELAIILNMQIEYWNQS